MNLEADFQRMCRAPSDINEHLLTFVDLVVELDAQHVIELGTRTGISTIGWLWGLTHTGGHLTSVDLDVQPYIGDYDHWTHIQGDDMDPEIIAGLAPAEIVFIDTSHTYDHTAAELEAYSKLVKPGGVIVLHDTENRIPEPAPPRPLFPVRKAIKEFCKAHGLDWLNYPNNYGLGIIRMGD